MMTKRILLSCVLAGVLTGCMGGTKQPSAPIRATDEGYAKIMEHKNAMLQEYAMIDWDARLKDIYGASITDLKEIPYDCELPTELYNHIGNYKLCKVINEDIKFGMHEKQCAAYAKKYPQGEIDKLKKAMPDWDGDLYKLQNYTTQDSSWTEVEITNWDKHYNLKMTNPQYEKCLKTRPKTDCYLQYGTGAKSEYYRPYADFVGNKKIGEYFIGTVRSSYEPQYNIAVKQTDVISDNELSPDKMYYISNETVNISGADFPVLKKAKISNQISSFLNSIMGEPRFAKEVQELCETLPEKKAEHEILLQKTLAERLPQSVVPLTDTSDKDVQ